MAPKGGGVGPAGIQSTSGFVSHRFHGVNLRTLPNVVNLTFKRDLGGAGKQAKGESQANNISPRKLTSPRKTPHTRRILVEGAI